MQTVTQGASVLTQQYDAAGNLINDGVHAYRYDAEGRLARVDAGTANEAVYTYDANNWRVKKVVGTGASAVTTYYVWEGAVVMAEYSTAAASGSGGLRFYHPDRLSTRIITDASGGVKGTQDHLPFGEDAGTVGETEKHRFTNYERDGEAGLDYAINRHHQSGNGRFMQTDPLGGHAGNPQSLSRYTYTLGDPINFIDPLGLQEKCYKWDKKKQELVEVPCDDPGEIDDDPIILYGWAPWPAVPSDPGGSFPGGWVINKLNAIKKAICSKIPSGQTIGVSGGVGAVGSVIGGGEIVVNYDSGQVSAFSFGGTQVGWNGGLSGSLYNGYIYGLNSSNSN